ncbi:YhcG family protein [Chryseobacterium sp. MDT2-18]|uniref:PDDEXK nuclease domain-containing protein n=1 Tax=Chryseobacterium sp. MDT2-18 TaxID=1259136 RepID=UPI0027817515|nr:PDDEXK nuclease domain-containing protein [Chryseobacterium sp. MDT2-18]MDQ0477524.1 putative nuclease of restriction endonuclease-like (RecB) superfamily [Chryseobacterium sp. MDT2-18]
MNFVSDIQHILELARQKSYSAINSAMVEAYWFVGKRIVEEEQNGEERAEYGKFVVKSLATELTKALGKGFSERNLRNFRQFYLTFPDEEMRYTLCAKLSWSHIRLIMRQDNEKARNYYLKESAENNWSVRTLDRNISTLYFERLLMSQNKKEVEEEMIEKTKDFQLDPFEFIKNPTVLEFLNLPNSLSYTEKELEKALIDNLQKFILELGKGFAFVERQKLIRTDHNQFFIDLVFYNYKLKCFVLLDLKTAKISHQDIGQMDMYVRMFDDLEKSESDNPTIGIVLCTETDSDIAKYSILKGNEQLFASKYKLFLPTEEELRNEIEREKQIFNAQFE